MAQHPDQAFPGVPLLFAQRMSDRTSNWWGRPACLNVVRRSSNLPLPPRKEASSRRRSSPQGSRPIRVQPPSGSAALRGLSQQAFSGSIDQLKALVAVEGKDRDIDFLHYLPQQRRGFKSIQSLQAERSPKGVDLPRDCPQRVVALPADARIE